MKTLNQVMSVNGTVLSNNDPDMVITLDSNPGVQISSIQDDSITYTFIGEVTEDTVYTPNLTFAYKGTHRTVVPLKFTHKPNTPAPYQILVTQESSDMVAAQSNAILFTLKDGDGNPITDATKVSMDITQKPNYRGVLAGWSNTLTNNSATKPGQYRISMNLGESTGTFTISLTVAVPGKTDSYKLENMVFTNPGSPVISVVDPNPIDAIASKQTLVNVTLTRDKYLQANAPAGGMLTVTGVNGPASSAVVTVGSSENGQYAINVTSDGNEGEIDINANYTPVVNDISWAAIPIVIKLNAVTPVETVPELINVTQAMSLKLWEQKPITFTVMANGTDITSGTSLTLNNDISSNLEFDVIGDGVWGIKAISADPLEDVTLPVKVNVHVNYNGNDYILPFEFNTTVVANTSGIPSNRFNIEFI